VSGALISMTRRAALLRRGARSAFEPQNPHLDRVFAVGNAVVAPRAARLRRTGAAFPWLQQTVVEYEPAGARSLTNQIDTECHAFRSFPICSKTFQDAPRTTFKTNPSCSAR